MKTIFAFLLAIVTLSPSHLHAQQLAQNIRGTVKDRDSQAPLVGATVMIVGSSPVLGAVSDIDGQFRITGVPIGRVTLKVTYMGYEDRIVSNLLITSSKEEILNIDLIEVVNRLDEIAISASQQKGEVLNEMAVVSAHTFSVEETQRFAGSFDDPARLVASFAGVQGNAEGNNDIIVRGNSPKGILWRLEGIAIPNPNHFAGEGSTGGPINALSSKMLSNSDFFTGAFAPEYGDVTSGVFDMKLKNGNNERREYTASLSTLGIDMTAEGPFTADSRASYITNYRYSALDLLDKAGVVDFGGVPRYQDMSFKIAVPFHNKHLLSFFGLGGISGIETEEIEDEDDDRITGRFSGKNRMGVLGVSHTYQINDAMYLTSTAAAMGTDNHFRYSIPDSDYSFYDLERGRIAKTSGVVTTDFNYKINARHKVETGIILTRLAFDMDAQEFDFDVDRLISQLAERGSAWTWQTYASWKYRLTEDVTVVGGLHHLRFTLNRNSSVEPRLSVRWTKGERQSFHAGVGIHSKLETLATYLSKRYSDDDTYTQPNKSLELTKAAHFVLGYDNRIGANSHLKVEAYFQHLYDVPVENSTTSNFSMLNLSEGFTDRQLVNAGTGRNYGVELTLERYFDQGLYYMSTLSLFRSRYTAMDGVERKSAFDNNYVANLIGGKEFQVGNHAKNKVFFVNTKVVLIGGQRYSPIDLDASIAAGHEITDELSPFSAKGDDIFRADFSIGLRRNRNRVTTEWKIDVQNIMNNQTVLGEYYVHATSSVRKATQLGMLPTLSYKVSF